MLKLAAIALVAIALALGAFSYWGLATKAGQRRYDEMDAYYPAFAGLGGVILILVGAGLWGLSWWLARER